LGNYYSATGDGLKAEKAYRQAISVLEAALEKQPGNQVTRSYVL
jgi:hypothetical protein